MRGGHTPGTRVRGAMANGAGGFVGGRLAAAPSPTATAPVPSIVCTCTSIPPIEAA